MKVIADLVERAVESMGRAGLSDSYVDKLSPTWAALDEWLSDRGVGYDPSLGDEFLRDEYGYGADAEPGADAEGEVDDGGKRTRTGVELRRRRALAVLRNCHEGRPYRRVQDRAWETRFASCHEDDLGAFVDEVAARCADSTVCAYVSMLNKLSPFLEGRGVSSVADVLGADLAAFLESVADSGVGQGLVFATAGRLRVLARWLRESGRTDRDVESLVPRAKAPEAEPPDTYTDEEVELIVGAIDASGPTGRRDLVVCLLAARLGMRSSDIVGLRLSNLLWREGAISFTSAKTGEPTVLPLTTEVGTAILAYLRDGRPESDEPYVLLRHVAPHTRMRPSRVYDIVSAAMTRAGIARDGRRRGPHALRASLATKMMRGGAPLHVVSRALSHSCAETSRFYLRAEEEGLRRCALEVPPLGGIWWPGGSR